MDEDALAKFCRRKREVTRSTHRAGAAAARVRRHSVYNGTAPLSASVGDTNVCPWPLTDDLVTVSIPTWQTPPQLLEGALRSVLAGRHQHVRVVMISDGEDRPSWEALPEGLRADRRVVCVEGPRNLGPYFNHDAVLRACEGPFFAVQDSDDESRPERFEVQLQALFGTRPDAIYSAVTNVFADGHRTVSRPAPEAGPVFSHRGDHFGLFSAAALRKLGGYYGGFRLGFDSVITSTLMMIGRVVQTDRALYVRRLRDGSLTRSAATGHGSHARKEEQAALREFYGAAWRAAQLSRIAGIAAHAGGLARGAAPHQELTRGLVAAIRQGIADKRMDKPPACDALVSAVRAAAAPTDWSISPELAVGLYRHCEQTRPRRILDVGSGLSTFMLALYAARYGAKLVSLEHDARWHARTREGLAAAGLSGTTQLLLRPLRAHRRHVWYHYDPGLEAKEPFDFVFIDGPPVACRARHAALFRLRDALRPGTGIWMHDAKRDAERAAISAWHDAGFRFSERMVDDKDPRGVFEFELQSDEPGDHDPDRPAP